jgi:hypothetical protein
MRRLGEAFIETLGFALIWGRSSRSGREVITA